METSTKWHFFLRKMKVYRNICNIARNQWLFFAGDASKIFDVSSEELVHKWDR